MFERGLTYQKTIIMVTELCCACGVAFGLPSDLHETLRNDPAKSFYCPNGHGQHYAKSREQSLREAAEREKDRLQQQLNNAAVEKIQLEEQLKKVMKDFTRLKKGTCPCCKRTFQNLKNHIKNQHPELLTK